MKPKGLLIFKAIVSLFDGIALLAVPVRYMAFIGITLGVEGSIAAQFFGTLLIGIGLICWFSKDGTRATIGGILLSLFITDVIGFILALRIQLAGLMNPLGWIVVVIWGLLALGLGYFRFLKKA